MLKRDRGVPMARFTHIASPGLTTVSSVLQTPPAVPITSTAWDVSAEK